MNGLLRHKASVFLLVLAFLTIGSACSMAQDEEAVIVDGFVVSGAETVGGELEALNLVLDPFLASIFTGASRFLIEVRDLSRDAPGFRALSRDLQSLVHRRDRMWHNAGSLEKIKASEMALHLVKLVWNVDLQPDAIKEALSGARRILSPPRPPDWDDGWPDYSLPNWMRVVLDRPK